MKGRAAVVGICGTRNATAGVWLAPLLLLTLVPAGCAFPPPAQPTATPVFRGGYERFFLPSPESQPTGITAGPDGAVWFTELSADGHIGRITSAGILTEFPSTTQAQGITAGPDGAVWFTPFLGDWVGRITPAGTVTEFPLPSAARGTYDITTGPDGALWFTEAYGTSGPAGGAALGDAIGRMTPSGRVTEFPLPTPNAGPQGITTGPDGALWFTEASGDQIGRISLTGTVTEFPIPTARSYPQTITTGPDGALWFTEQQGNQIGRITPAGTIRELHIPNGGAPWGITAGPDGALWFTDTRDNLIARVGFVAPTPVPTATAAAVVPTGSDGSMLSSAALQDLDIESLQAASLPRRPN